MNKLLKYLLCLGDCKGGLKKERSFVVCKKCKQKYPFKNGVVDMITDKSLDNDHNAQQKEYYDTEYEKVYANRDFEWRKRYKKRLFSFLPKEKNSVVLDLASGQGYITLAVARKKYDVIACDISTAGLYRSYDKAKKLKIDNRILFVAGDINKLNFAKDTFNFIILLHVLEHMEGDKRVIKRLFDFSRKNCTFYIGVSLSLVYVFPLLKRFYMASDKQVGHIRRYTIDSVQSLFGRKGKLISAIYTGHLIKFLGVIFSYMNVFSFDKLIENLDEKQLSNPTWASNLTAVFQLNYEKK